MDREKLKVLIQNVEMLLDEMKSIAYSEEETHKISETVYEEEELREVSTDELILNMYSNIPDDLWNQLKPPTSLRWTPVKRL